MHLTTTVSDCGSLLDFISLYFLGWRPSPQMGRDAAIFLQPRHSLCTEENFARTSRSFIAVVLCFPFLSVIFR